jgi:hypothetical protein
MHCGELRRGREAEKDKNLFIEKMIENVWILASQMDMQTHEVQKSKNKVGQNFIAWHILIKLSKGKDRILKAVREKWLFQ